MRLSKLFTMPTKAKISLQGNTISRDKTTPGKTTLWTPNPERVASCSLNCFINRVNDRWNTSIVDFLNLYTWSVENPQKFWSAIAEHCKIFFSNPFNEVLRYQGEIWDVEWFPGATLNFSQHLLKEADKSLAIVFRGENLIRKTLSRRELYTQVASVAAWLKQVGVGIGDRVVAFMPNIPETVVAMLACNSLGAVWSSCSPDFGVPAVIDRFGQIEPKVLFVSDSYLYKGEKINLSEKITSIKGQIPSLEQTVCVPYFSNTPLEIKETIPFSKIIENSCSTISFEQLPFDHPAFILFSSGTTGKPKCIVHRAGGVLIEHLKELQLHTDLRSGDTFFYQTTCGWMMWNWLVSGLAVGATLILYDGFPMHEGGHILWRIAQEEKINVFGTNAKYLSLCEKMNIKPNEKFDLSPMRTILSTGSPLLPENFDYFYKEVNPSAQLSSISGGTDIVGCFALGCPTLPVRRGELQCRSLGLDVEVFNDQSLPVRNEKGELVCRAPFPSMPLGFWNDTDRKKFKSSYFDRFPNVWCHGDLVELSDSGGMIFYGRSDAILNPGGVRIGTAEIYNQVEKIPEVLESVAVSQEWKGDQRIILFVKLREDETLTDELKRRISSTIRSNTSPFHVPKKILQVADIPRTVSGKIVELAIRETIHGRPVKNIEALSNPSALSYFRERAELLGE